MTKKLKSGTPFVYDENDRVVGIRDPHTGTDTDLVTAVTGPGGGNRLFAGGDVISMYQDALRFAFPMRFESGSSPARDSSGRGTQLLVTDPAPWDTGWLKGASSQTRRISADSMRLDLARDSFVFSFLYKAPAGLATAICGTNSFGTFSETMGSF